MTSAISCPLWSLVYEYQRLECVFTSPLRTECGMFVMYCLQCCMSVSAVSRRYVLLLVYSPFSDRVGLPTHNNSRGGNEEY